MKKFKYIAGEENYYRYLKIGEIYDVLEYIPGVYGMEGDKIILVTQGIKYRCFVFVGDEPLFIDFTAEVRNDIIDNILI